MEVHQSLNSQQYKQNFGMALIIDKKAEQIIESLSPKERQYIRALGERIKNSRNDINIGKNGEVYLTYSPKASDFRLVKASEKASVEAENKAHNKKLNSQITLKEKIVFVIEDLKTLFNILRIKMSPTKSRFMKDLQVNAEYQKSFDRSDALEERLKARL